MRFKFLPVFFLSLVLAAAGAQADTAMDILDEIPVQHKGRLKPFQSFARETALRVLSAEKAEGFSASKLMWEWMAKPEDWSKRPIIPVARMLQADFPLMLVKGRLSPEVLLQHRPFIEKAEEAWNKKKKKERLTAVEKERLDLYDRAQVFQAVATGTTPGFIGHPDNPHAAWLPFQGLSVPETQESLAQLYSETHLIAAGKALADLLETLRADVPAEEITPKAEALRTALRELHESKGIYLDSTALKTELLYNRLHPFGWAWKHYLIAALFFAAAMLFSNAVFSKSLAKTAIVLWAAGFLIHLTGFVLRCLVAGRPPVTNMYESVIWVSWAAVFFSIILFAVYRNFLIPMTSSLVGTLTLLVAESFPVLLDPSISPLVPVLRSNLWLTVHVLTITLSYGAFALAWGLGHVVVIGYVRRPFDTEGRQRLSSYLYRALQIGVILLASGTVLGGVWANYSWGRFWGWDPKETWALIALLGYLVVLHGRFTGWLDSFGAAAASVGAFTGVVMAWYGVNYVLAAGLHSYGFGGGGAPYVIAVALADLALVAVLSVIYRRKMARGAAVLR
jgi:ABC-type transport system involved in cytochrome c biogenesis permease subunit